MGENPVNRDILVYAIIEGVSLGKVARLLGITHKGVILKLKKELPQEEREWFFATITNLAKEQEGEEATI